MPTQAEIDNEKHMLEGDGAFFVKNNCFICHSVSSFGIKSASEIGPDLSIAVEDVPSRFGRTLGEFLQDPTGTMAVVLSTQIPLTKEQRNEATELLKVAYQRRLEQQIKHATPSPTPAGK
ncbi:MAG: hypothetical protein M9893_05395 [Pyrinomonadaceae bacterium]|nr:hypothetical protein [Pyrinomonadaceae bacterium]